VNNKGIKEEGNNAELNVWRENEQTRRRECTE
jgi:hypothetical protein